MRLTLLLFTSFVFAFTAAPDVSAQVTPVGGGCNPGGGAPGTPFSVGGLPPRINTPNFAIGYNPPANTVASFWLIGICETTNPLPDFPDVGCGVPCGATIDFTVPPILGGQDVPPTPVQAPIPLPNVPALVGITVCLQMASFSSTTCTEISQGVSIQILP